MPFEFAPSASPETLRQRAALLSFTRRFFEQHGYLEVETPLLSPDIVVDTHLEPFSTRFRPDPTSGRGTELFLQTSPEFSLKRLLTAGVGPVFEVFRAFRNGEAGMRHNPEFSLIEWYRPGDTHHDQMAFTEEFVRGVFREAARFPSGSPSRSPSPLGLGVRGKGCDHGHIDHFTGPSASQEQRPQEARESSGHPLTPGPSPREEGKRMVLNIDEPFERLTYDEAFARFAGTKVQHLPVAALADLAGSGGVSVPAGFAIDESARDEWLNLLLAELVEPHLGRDRPAFLYDYPASQAALAVIRHDDPPVAERFELYIDGIELCNGYHELLDANELRCRNTEQNAKRAALGLRTLPADSRLLAAMDHGLPACSGVALGFDRLLMVVLDKSSIGDVRAFLTEGTEIEEQGTGW